ncbi:sulfurtransferase [Glaciimonas sp. Gout2]|uniref:sulfurtransferase n=1 Tax=unclassified Glaciimonas TaxID=2644401 RepID=UPI002B229D69|nr:MULTISPECIES: sulfurtransferase [unclassified Glaciimonas]MEB0012381.1 sulfurtransferase [Glaciimonas sp. Cout2]MEB0080427.1 sulfurtransferase [Glaciimonas sp. Gout2]
MSSTPTYVNIAAYKFITFDDTAEKRAEFLATCTQLQLRGTILLSPEGINMFLAGFREQIDQFLVWLRSDPRFADVEVKESYSENQPFTRMLVKLKAEIITMKHPLIKPELGRAPSVAPKTLKRWLDQGHDDNGRPVVMVDTRNGFEVDVGTFENTVDYRIDKFSEFPEVISAHKEALIDKTVVTFCTGGIRCEKAAIHMQEIGFDSVYQLDGGILKYFEECGGAHYNGDCFVFDYRTALNPQLQETAASQCFICRTVVTPREQLSPEYIIGVSCPHCATNRMKKMSAQDTTVPEITSTP